MWPSNCDCDKKLERERREREDAEYELSRQQDQARRDRHDASIREQRARSAAHEEYQMLEEELGDANRRLEEAQAFILYKGLGEEFSVWKVK